MSEENNEALDLAPAEESQFTETEEKALDRGWKPLEEFDGEEEQFVGAAEFVRNGQLMDTISASNRREKASQERLQKLEEGIKVLGDHNKKVQETAYNRALAQLKQQKANAMEEMDHSRVVEIDDKLIDLKSAREKVATTEANLDNNPAPVSNAGTEAFDAWRAANSWYDDSAAMRGAADSIGRDAMASNPKFQQDPQALFAHVDEQMREEFPSKFGQRRRPAAGTEYGDATSQTRRQTSTRGATSRMNDMQREVGALLVKEGAFTNIQEYADQLKAIGEL